MNITLASTPSHAIKKKDYAEKKTILTRNEFNIILHGCLNSVCSMIAKIYHQHDNSLSCKYYVHANQQCARPYHTRRYKYSCQENSNLSIGQRTVAHMGAKMWDNIPELIKTATSVECLETMFLKLVIT